MAYGMNLSTTPVTISNGTSLSPAVPLGAASLLGIAMPAAWTAANLTFQVSDDGGTTWNEFVDSYGNAITVVAAASQHIQISPTVFAGVNMVKVRSGTGGSPVNQGADRVLTLVGRVLA